MREILFRGKDTSGVLNYQWQYGSLYNSNPNAMFPTIIRLDRYGNKMFVEVDPETVGQYTGAIDKNNRKMFEGDIVEDICGGIGTIVYQKDECAFYVDLGDTYDTVDGKLYTVIGNVYDNPELLKGENLVEELPWEE